MKRNYFAIITLSALLLTCGGLSVHGQYSVDYSKVPDYNKFYNPDYSLNSHIGTKSKAYKTGTTRPDHWNNAILKYFPPIFNQAGPSCMGSAYVGYNFTNEINSLRDKDGSLEENQYAIFFNWLFTYCNSGKESMLRNVGDPTAVVYGGRTYSSKFGYCDWKSNNFGWMQGYDKWYSAMFNRITSSVNFPQSVATEEGREAVKQWVWNHNGDSAFHGGGVCYIVLAAGLTQAKIKSTPANQAAGVVGKNYVENWGSEVNHALTIVGYDDRIEFDLDSNGVYGEQSKDEVGAWIIMNSWGSGWSNGGYIYCPYKYGGAVRHADYGYWSPQINYVRKNYRPLRTIKIKMDYSKRSEMRLMAGISADTAAATASMTTTFDHFNYGGDGDGDGVDAETPMLGYWIDGMHYEPMEFGYDLTDLSANFDRSKPLKYFFYIYTKSSANGTGHIYNCSIMDYEFDRMGIEEPFKVDTVLVKNGGKVTIISMIVPGEQINKPINLGIAGNTLSWQAPQASSLKIGHYYVYADNKLIDSVNADKLTYTVNDGSAANYAVAAEYIYNGNEIISEKTNSVRDFTYQAPTTNYVLNAPNSGFVVPDVFSSPLSEATIEFWLKPSSYINWNQQIGPGWGSFLMHSSSSGQVVVGWDTNNRISSTNSALTLNKWNHIAVTIKGNTMTLYINGIYKGRLTSTSYSGMPAIGNLTVGSNNSPMNGQIDEFRIWKVCRLQADIINGMKQEIANPAAQSNLIAYFKMDRINDGGVEKLNDCAGGHHANLFDVTSETAAEDNSFLTGSTNTLKADFSIPAGDKYAGTAVQLTAKSSVNIVEWTWQAPEANINSLKTQNPLLIFEKDGTFPVKLTVKDNTGATADTTMSITIMPVEKPAVNFDIASTSMPAGDHFSFINRSQGINCSYTWSMPGADIETVNGTNAGASYVAMGKHDVTLTATNAAGSSSITKTIEVTAIAPTIKFTVTPSAIIKGDMVYFKDQSAYKPTKWLWDVKSNSQHIGITRAYTSFTPTRPGYYDVSLTASNSVGQNTATLKRAFVVCNADSKLGLHFVGSGERVEMNSPITADTRQFTFDWWMFPEKLANCNYMSTSDDAFTMTTDENGAMSITLNNKTVKSPDGYAIVNEWHHYAVIYRTGTVTFYRDGIKISTPVARLAMSCPAWTGKLTIGSTSKPIYGLIDEFRVWNKALGTASIMGYCNAPIENVDSAMSNDGLQVYYNFNQGSGNATDLTKNANTGIRVGFGPDGDAWNTSLGVFSLDFSTAEQSKDVTSTYMTNYQRPFRHTSVQINPKTANRFYQLETGTAQSGWIIKNSHVTDTITTEVHVDATKNYDLTMESEWSNFASPMNNHRVYQVVTLPAGIYTFSVSHLNEFQATGCYLVATVGDTLAGDRDIDRTLAYDDLNNATISFRLAKETQVSLGIIYNIAGQTCVTVNKFTLIQEPYTQIEGDPITNIFDAVNEGRVSKFTPISGGLRIVSEKTLPIKIYTTDGMCIFNEFVSGVKRIQLPEGIYIVNGEKFSIPK